MSRNLYELPRGWALGTIPDLIGDGIFTDGDWVESKDQDPYGNIRLVQLADIGDGYFIDKSSRYLNAETADRLNCTFLQKDDVLVARMPEPLGRACLCPAAEQKAVTVVDVCVIRGKPENFNPKWLMHFINSSEFRGDIAALQSGSTRKRISRGNLSTVELPIPPRKEQDRIAEKIEVLLLDLDEGVAELKTAQEKLTQYRQTLLKSAVEGTLTKDWREANTHKTTETGEQFLTRILKERRARWEKQKFEEFASKGQTPPKNWKDKYPEPIAPDTSDLPELPEGWIWASVDQLAAVQLGKMLDKNKHKDGQLLPYLRNLNVRWSSIDVNEVFSMFFKEAELEQYSLCVGDILVCEGGEPGRAAICREEHTKYKFQKALHRVRLFGYYEPEFFVIYLEYLSKTGVMEGNFTGTTIKHLTRESFISIPFPLPPLLEQVELLKKFNKEKDSISNKKDSIKASILQSEVQRKNILNNAFSGRLVEQNPADNPASLLLEKIKADRDVRDKLPKQKKTKKKQGYMNNFNINTFKKWIKDHEEDAFSFDDISTAFQVDYETIKNSLFDVLSEGNPIIKQSFNKKIGKIIFKRIMK